jgi:hypothetical protein
MMRGLDGSHHVSWSRREDGCCVTVGSGLKRVIPAMEVVHDRTLDACLADALARETRSGL